MIHSTYYKKYSLKTYLIALLTLILLLMENVIFQDNKMINYTSQVVCVFLFMWFVIRMKNLCHGMGH